MIFATKAVYAEKRDEEARRQGGKEAERHVAHAALHRRWHLLGEGNVIAVRVRVIQILAATDNTRGLARAPRVVSLDAFFLCF